MITLRHAEPRDQDAMRLWRNLPGVARYMYTDHEIAAEEHERWFSAMLNNRAVEYWIVEDEGTGIGIAMVADISREHRRCSWGFYLIDGQASRGAGAYVEYGVLSHAFETLALEKVSCEILADNERVISLHGKFGFKPEGRLRSHVRKGGERLDVICMGLLKDEWTRFRATPLAGRLAAGVRVGGE